MTDHKHPPIDLVDPRRSSSQADRVAPGAPWMRSRFAALLPLVGSPDVAAALVAHSANETGKGRAEWNWNLGNMRWWDRPQRAFFQRGSDDPAGGAPYVSHASLAEGARAFAYQVSHHHYTSSWAFLRNGGDPRAWYARLCAEGWHAPSDASTRHFDRLLAEVRAAVGLPPLALGEPPTLASLGIRAPASRSRGSSGPGNGAALGALALAFVAWRAMRGA